MHFPMLSYVICILSHAILISEVTMMYGKLACMQSILITSHLVLRSSVWRAKEFPTGCDVMLQNPMCALGAASETKINENFTNMHSHLIGSVC